MTERKFRRANDGRRAVLSFSGMRKLAKEILLFIVAIILGCVVQPRDTVGQGLTLQLGKTTNGFHIPREWDGRTIVVTPVENEHAVYSIEDMFSAAGLKNDVLVGQTRGINNAFAVIDGAGDNLRRLIVIDPEWSYRFASYRVILAHELGHHVCRHTLDRFNASNRWAMELEADRAGAALLRKSYADGHGSVGGGIIDLATIIETFRATGPGSDTHPPAEMRVKAAIEGWNNGSPCLSASYIPINPWLRREDVTLIERISVRYGTDIAWCFFGPDLRTTGPCLAKYPRVRVEIDGNQLKIFLVQPNSDSVLGVFPPDYRQAKPGSLLLSASSDKETIKGTFWHLAPGCEPVPYEVEGKFFENSGIFLTGRIPRMNGCEVNGSHNATLHFFKNLTDIF